MTLENTLTKKNKTKNKKKRNCISLENVIYLRKGRPPIVSEGSTMYNSLKGTLVLTATNEVVPIGVRQKMTLLHYNQAAVA